MDTNMYLCGSSWSEEISYWRSVWSVKCGAVYIYLLSACAVWCDFQCSGGIRCMTIRVWESPPPRIWWWVRSGHAYETEKKVMYWEFDGGNLIWFQLVHASGSQEVLFEELQWLGVWVDLSLPSAFFTQKPFVTPRGEVICGQQSAAPLHRRLENLSLMTSLTLHF